MSNLKQCGTALVMYFQDYDERFPPMANPALNYVSGRKIPSFADTVALRDAKPHMLEDGKPGWNVCYVDGHAQLTRTEPVLGKLAPTPTRAQSLREELEGLRQQRRALDA